MRALASKIVYPSEDFQKQIALPKSDRAINVMQWNGMESRFMRLPQDEIYTHIPDLYPAEWIVLTL